MRFLVLIAICLSIISCDGAAWRDDDTGRHSSNYHQQSRENARRRRLEYDMIDRQAETNFRHNTICQICGNNIAYCKCGSNSTLRRR